MFLDLLKKRRSIRRFESTPVEDEKIEILLESVLRSPSSRSRNPWEFIVVQDRDSLSRLASVKPHGASFVKDASLAIVVCADPECCDVWIEDCSIASMLLHLAAADLGLGSCWVQVRMREHSGETMAEDKVRQILGLADNLVVEAMIAIGYPAEVKASHAKSSLLYDRIHYEKFGNKKPSRI